MKNLIKKILREYVNESLDSNPINFKKIYDDEYLIYDENIKANVYFRIELDQTKYEKFHLNKYKTNNVFYEISWGFNKEMNKTLINHNTWRLVTVTVPLVIKDFLQNNKVDILRFTPRHDKMSNIYNSSYFINLIKNNLPNNFTLINTNSDNIIIIRNDLLS